MRYDRGREGITRWFTARCWASWVISGVGLALAGLSLWYLIVLKARYIGTAFASGGIVIVLRSIEVLLLAGFSLVLLYGGYWVASSTYDDDRLWWAGLWTIVGLAGVVALVALVTAFQVMQGRTVSDPILVQEMLLAAGGGALAGLLIGISTVRESVEEERARRQRDTLLFVNRLLRHNVLNGMNIIQGNTDRIHERVDDGEADRYLASTREQSEAIVDLIQDVRALMRSVSGEERLQGISLASSLEPAVDNVRSAYPDATIACDPVPDSPVRADRLLDAVFENLLTNAVEHNDSDAPHVEVAVADRSDGVAIRIADNGPGVPTEIRNRVFEPGEYGTESTGQGLGLYLVATLVERYGGEVAIEDSEPRGTVFVVELQRH
jgi:signal transduction histidine kinase